MARRFVRDAKGRFSRTSARGARTNAKVASRKKKYKKNLKAGKKSTVLHKKITSSKRYQKAEKKAASRVKKHHVRKDKRKASRKNRSIRRSSVVQRYGKEQIRRNSIRKKTYKGRGGYARQINDLANSQGAFKNNIMGKPVSSRGRRYQKSLATNYKLSIPYAVSSYRGKRK